MKLGTKIFFFVTLFFSILFLLGGYTLISYFYDATIEREIENATEQYQHNKFVIQAALITKGEEWFRGIARGEYDVSDMVSDMNHTIAFYQEDGSLLYSQFPRNIALSELLEKVKRGSVNYQFLKVENRTNLFIIGMVVQKDTALYFVTGVDIENIMEQHEQMIRRFAFVYAGAIGISMVIIFGLSALLTKPIKCLTEATKKIADGNYQERITVKSSDEVGQLASNFNQMAAAIEEKVEELLESGRQKENFVSNFSHELKTPLTSVIGYANRIYQKELSREEQKKAAWYIWNEGMRLEALSSKLLDLTILNQTEFVLQEMNTDSLLQELAQDIAYLMEEKKILFQYKTENTVIKVEYDLFKTLFLNLIDNSIKAGTNSISVIGVIQIEGETTYYEIQIEDNGVGIPVGEIERIKEAFYMVDKSRSRKLHGAGIGLSLAEKIVKIHGGILKFESDGICGTKAYIRLGCKGRVTE